MLDRQVTPASELSSQAGSPARHLSRVQAPWGLQLWRVELDAPPNAAMLASLSHHERTRAERFVFERDRRRYVHAHAAVRELLSQNTGVPAAALPLREGLFGKPYIEGGACGFNLSHSGDIALVAIADGPCECGVDIEVLKAVDDARALAQQVFTRAECEALEAMPSGQRDRAFLALWTRKEACLKAVGMGLSLAPQSFECGLDAEDSSVQLVAREGVVCVQVQSLSWADAVGAVAVVSSLRTRA